MVGRQTKPPGMNMLFNALGSKSSDRRYRALLEAQELTSEQLTEMVEMATRRGRSSSRLNQAKAGFVLMLLIGGLFSPANSAFSFPVWALSLLLGLSVCFWVGEMDPCRPPTRWHMENLIRLLEMRSEKGSAGAVLMLLEKAEGEPCDRLLALLLRLLPDLRADDAREWSAQQREPFLRVLRAWHKNTELAYAILRAMPEIGGTWALDAVEHLAKLKYWNPDRLRSNYTKVRRDSLPWQSRLQDDLQPTQFDIEAMLDAFKQIGTVAADCLPGLQEKIKEDAAAQMLLRPAEIRSHTEELLRPAVDKGAMSDSTNLLRPGRSPTMQAEERTMTSRQ
ncbi:MAG: hypothetical protein JWN14_4841 [Chthonomonadales bacterium]|nr:hypothetical protein [Chthonomonadales bacterium]